ncbi:MULTISPECIES: asparaginase [unclassified Fusibacter]|uniref:asparaginase n=1 Tax=unclassified Fusibacter TaxID=2624464 RepID=UPI0010107326|nr:MULTISPECIES: asparaginase [unclassified Fusibacter]MCK8061281.1 asparaginase [Fusibacter sp. A2]NPE23521.1 asparaginase [Fusibacter sp. A1]RXV59125.1 asparaginase [Fusibacter sp. A1]
MLKKIAVVFTGGTISMKVDPRISAAIPAMSSEEIMSMVTNIDKLAEIEIVSFSRLPGPQMTPKKMHELRAVVLGLIARDDISGVVITHGTDSLEETAYYLDLSINTPKPIVMVAAMRNGSELGYDGPSNLSAAICTATSDKSRMKGVLIVLNNEVNAASETTKTHTMSLDTFKSLEFGPLGIVDNDQVIYYRNITKHQHIEVDTLEENVHLIKTAVGMDSLVIDFLIDKGAKGFVIEAMGRGNIPPEMMSGIGRALELNIPVVIVSRCPMGRVLGSYGYDGGGKQLHDLGAIFGCNLNGQKARIKLMLAKAFTDDMNQIKLLFENGYYE